MSSRTAKRPHILLLQRFQAAYEAAEQYRYPPYSFPIAAVIFTFVSAVVFATSDTFAAPESVSSGTGIGAGSEAQLARAVGRLLIPAIRYENGYPRHYDERCSATLIAMKQTERSPYLLSAWHCLEDYRDLSRSLLYADSKGTQHQVRIVATGGGMDRDWALLKIQEQAPHPIVLAQDEVDEDAAVTLAGFPRSKEDSALSVLRDCAITGKDGQDLRTDCVLQRGASGGAVLSNQPSMDFVGVISRGDGVSQSIFVPISRFLKDIRRYLLEDS